jgi:hypothetical protein
MAVLLMAPVAFADEDQALQERIFNSYLEQAQQGDANAQFVVASRYETGKGTGKDIKKAYYWFEKAAENGQPLAQLKLEERAEAQAAAAPKPPTSPTADLAGHRPTVPPEPARSAGQRATRSEPVAKPKERAATVETIARQKDAARPLPAKTPPAPVEPVRIPEPLVVAKTAVSEAPAPTINIAQAVLGGRWGRNRRAAEILPSPVATCLQSSSTEIVCFSQELTRNVGGQGVTYTVKATLSGVGNRDGHLSINYLYNVIDVNDRPFAQPSSGQADFADLAARNGWQEPGLRLDCRLTDERNLACARPDRKLSYQFVRE